MARGLFFFSTRRHKTEGFDRAPMRAAKAALDELAALLAAEAPAA